LLKWNWKKFTDLYLPWISSLSSPPSRIKGCKYRKYLPFQHQFTFMHIYALKRIEMDNRNHPELRLSPLLGERLGEGVLPSLWLFILHSPFSNLHFGFTPLSRPGAGPMV
jgi:hypothetical protein